MRIQDIKTSPHFERQYKKLPREIKKYAQEKENIFRHNPFEPQLKTHRLHGRQSALWAFWINYRYRIIFLFLHDDEVLFLEIGTHEIYA